MFCLEYVPSVLIFLSAFTTWIALNSTFLPYFLFIVCLSSPFSLPYSLYCFSHVPVYLPSLSVFHFCLSEGCILVHIVASGKTNLTSKYSKQLYKVCKHAIIAKYSGMGWCYAVDYSPITAHPEVLIPLICQFMN